MSIEDFLHPLLRYYLEAPSWLRTPAAGRAYAAERLTLQKLEEILRWTIQTVPAYRQYRALLARPDDPRRLLALLRVTDKTDIKRDPARYLSSAMPASRRLEMFTGGSTRNPMQFYLQKHRSRPKEYAFVQDFADEPAGGDGGGSAGRFDRGGRHTRRRD
jgi:hypothetical protein